MPNEPKRRHSKARKRVRRASISLGTIALVVCKNCGKKTTPHIACVECGFYAGKLAGKPKAVVTKA